METDSSSPFHENEIQSAIRTPPAQHETIIHNHINIVSDDEYYSITPSPVQKQRYSNFKVHFELNKVCTTCFTAVIGAVLLALAISCSVFAAIVALPLLIASFLVLRLLQFFRYGDDYDKTVQLKLFIRTWILLDMIFYLCLLWFLFALSKSVPILNHFIGLPISNWLNLCNMIFGIYVLSYAIAISTINFLPSVSSNHRESRLNVPEGVLEMIDCLILWFVESKVITTRVPAFEHHKILGLYTRYWIEVSILVLISYNVISLSTHTTVWFLQKFVCDKLDPGLDKTSLRYLIIQKFLRKKYIVYCANGMQHGINFILSSLLLLFTWVLYFGSRLDRTTPHARKNLEFGFWTCGCLLICSVFWLIKTCVILSWEARSVYDRLHWKIKEGGKQLYFLGIIGRHKYDIFNLFYEVSAGKSDDGKERKNLCSDLCNTVFPTRVITLDAHYQQKSDEEDVWGSRNGVKVRKLSKEKQNRVKQDLLAQQGNRTTMYCVLEFVYKCCEKNS